MQEGNVHVFKRNMDSINVTLEHILNGDSIPKEIIQGHFKLIRETLNHCEELALNETTK